MPETADPKPLRADALRNREKLLSAAVQVFTEQGADAPLEAVAKQAGVGIGTLYRHFPDRSDLIAAAYLSEVDQLRDSADELLADNPPDVALELWMERFIAYTMTKRGMIDALKSVMDSKAGLFSGTKDKMMDSVTLLLDAGQKAGTIRSDVDAEDVMRSMSSVWSIDDPDDWPDRPRRIFSLLMDGLRVRPDA